MLPVKWTDNAKQSLYALIGFIAEQNPFAAESLLHQHAVAPALRTRYRYDDAPRYTTG